jgi:two-component system NtrC family response regulator/two-component system nitrogen regulation response regulator GlnG
MRDPQTSAVTTGKRRAAPILVVEDEVDLRNSYERILRRLNLDVIAVERAADGLDIARSQAVRLVITDLKLPDMDGIALIRAFRACADPPPIIVASGLDSAATRRAALEAGAIAYLTKPFSIATLTAKVQEALEELDGQGVSSTATPITSPNGIRRGA